MMTEYPKCVQDQLVEMEKRRERLLSWLPLVRLAEEAIAECSSALGSTSVSVGLDMGEVNGVLIHANVKQDILEVVPMLRYLRAHGAPKFERTEDYPEIKRRIWHFGDLKVMVFLPYRGGAKCDFVQVGVREEPVYELRCDGATIKDAEL